MGSKGQRAAGVPRAGVPGAGEPKSWYSRGYLPHLDQPGLYQSITYRLADSVPEEVIKRWKEELLWRAELPNDDEAVLALRRRIVSYEDAGHGACWLGDERVATIVQNNLCHFDGSRYRLMAWCIMPNHVHVLIESFPGYSIGDLLHTWKSFTSHEANKLLGRDGPFWARDYYDRYIRDDEHFAQTLAYIEQNPVKAALVTSPNAWEFSSASQRG